MTEPRMSRLSERVIERTSVQQRADERVIHNIMLQCEPVSDATTVVIAVNGLTPVQLKQVLHLVTCNMPLRMAVQFALMPDEHQDLYSSMAERWPQAIKRAVTEARA